MDWGIVASIIVAMVLFVLGMMMVCGPVFLFMMRRMKKTMQAGNMPGCPMPCGSSSGENNGPNTQCTSESH